MLVRVQPWQPISTCNQRKSLETRHPWLLCGHDEREWFVAAVPGGASSVRQAMDALQPSAVRDALAQNQVSSAKRYSRKNRDFRRQGEWFFVPSPRMAVDEKLVLRHEPLRRGSGKPPGGTTLDESATLRRWRSLVRIQPWTPMLQPLCLSSHRTNFVNSHSSVQFRPGAPISGS